MAEKKGPTPGEIKKAAPAHLKALTRYLMSDEPVEVKGWDEAMKKGGFIPLEFRKMVYGVHQKMSRISKTDRKLYTEGRIPVSAKNGVKAQPLILQVFPYLFMLKKIKAYNKTVNTLRKYNIWNGVIDHFEDYLKKRGGSKKALTALYNDSLTGYGQDYALAA